MVRRALYEAMMTESSGLPGTPPPPNPLLAPIPHLVTIEDRLGDDLVGAFPPSQA